MPSEPLDRTDHVQNTSSSETDQNSIDWSSTTFAKPLDFLTILKYDLPSASDHKTESDVQNQLYSLADSSVPLEAAAGKIALAHYDELRELANVSSLDRPDPNSGISSDEVQKDIDLIQGTTKKEYLSKLQQYLPALIIEGGSTVAMAVGVATSVEVPPVTGLFIAALAISGGMTGVLATGLNNLPTDLIKKGIEDRKVLASWRGING